MSFIHQIKVPIRWPARQDAALRPLLSWRLDPCSGRPVMAWRLAPARRLAREEETQHERRK